MCSKYFLKNSKILAFFGLILFTDYYYNDISRNLLRKPFSLLLNIISVVNIIKTNYIKNETF